MNTTNVLTRSEYRSRRAMMTQLVRKGAERSDVARWFGVGLTTVYRACQENGLPGKRGPKGFSVSTYSILARLFDSGVSLSGIAIELGVSFSLIQKIYREATKAGIPVPDRPPCLHNNPAPGDSSDGNVPAGPSPAAS